MEKSDLMPSVFVKFFEDAVERTEAEIEELRLAGLLRDDPQPQTDVAGRVISWGETTTISELSASIEDAWSLTWHGEM